MMSSSIETEYKLLLPNAAAARRVRDALGTGPVVVQQNHFFDRPDRSLAAARIAVRLRAEDDRRWLTVKGDELGRPGSGWSRRIELETELTPAEFDAALAEGLDLVRWLPRLEAAAAPGERSPALIELLDALRASARAGRLVRIDGFGNRRERLRLALRDEHGAFEVALELDETRFPSGSQAGARIDHEIEVELESEPAPRGPAAHERVSGAQHAPRGSNASSDAAVMDAGRPDPDRVERALRRWLRELGIDGVLPAPSKLARLRDAGATPT